MCHILPFDYYGNKIKCIGYWKNVILLFESSFPELKRSSNVDCPNELIFVHFILLHISLKFFLWNIKTAKDS